MPNHRDVLEGGGRGLADLGGIFILVGVAVHRAEVPAVEPCPLRLAGPGTPPPSCAGRCHADGNLRANIPAPDPSTASGTCSATPAVTEASSRLDQRTSRRRLESTPSARIIKRSLDRHSTTIVMTQATSEAGLTRSALLRPDSRNVDVTKWTVLSGLKHRAKR